MPCVNVQKSYDLIELFLKQVFLHITHIIPNSKSDNDLRRNICFSTNEIIIYVDNSEYQMHPFIPGL